MFTYNLISNDTIILTSLVGSILSIFSFLATFISAFITNRKINDDLKLNVIAQEDSVSDKLEGIDNDDDKIAQIKRILTRRRNNVGSISIFTGLLSILFVSVVIYDYSSPESIEFDKQISFDESTDKLKILILPFQKPKNSDNDVELFLKNRFIELKDENGLNLDIKLIGANYARSFKEAKAIGEKLNSDIVIFGKYDQNLKIQICYVVINNEIREVEKEGKSDYAQIKGITDISQGYLQEDLDKLIFWTLGLKDLKKKKFGSALKYLDQIPEVEDDDFKVQIQKARLICMYKVEGKFFFDQYFEENIESKKLPISYFDLGYFANEYLYDRSIGIELYNREMELDSTAAVYNNLALSYLENDQYELAEDYQRKAIKTSPRQASFYNNLAIIYSKDYFKKYEASKRLYLRAIELDSLNTGYYNNLGDLLCKDYFNDLLYAKIYYNKAIEIDPSDKSAYINLADLEYYNNRSPDDALSYLKKAESIYPEDSQIKNEIGQIYHYGKKNYQKAKNYYEKAIELNNNNAYAYKNLGELFEENYKVFDKLAEKYYRTAIKILPDEPNFYNALGNLQLYKFKEYELARNNFKNALSIKGLNNIQKAIFLGNYGTSYDRLKQYEMAEKYYLQALEYDEKNVYSSTKLYLLYDKTQRYREAKKYFDKSSELKPETGDHLYKLSLILKVFFKENF